MIENSFLRNLDYLERRLDKVIPEGPPVDYAVADLRLMDFIPAMSPQYERPEHLAPIVEVLERMAHEEVRVVAHTPPRHGKTDTILHWVVRELMRNPAIQIGYATHSSDMAGSKSNRAKRLLERTGVRLTTDKSSEWRTPQNGGLLARGLGSGWTGHGLDRLIIDDPVKNVAEAESPTYRRRTWEWFDAVAMTRVEPGGSVLVNMARWHPDDLAGELIRRGWEYIRLPAIADEVDDLLGRNIGEALWPTRWPLELLADRMRNKYTADSLYQGRPRGRGNTVFSGVYFYDELPANGYRIAHGLDLAYTAKTSADWSVDIVLRACEGKVYVVDVVRKQVKATAFAGEVKLHQQRYPGTVRIYYGGGGEQGALDWLRQETGLPINAIHASADKFVRAQPVASAWNRGEVLVPREAPWLDDFVSEVLDFTGVNDAHDDQVDALAAGFDELDQTGPIDYRTVATRRYAAMPRGWA